MFNLTILLLALAMLLMFAELFTGTEVFGAVGIIALIVSAIIAVLFVPGGWFIVGGQVVLLVVFVRFAIRQVRKKQLSGRIILHDTLTQDIPRHQLDDLLGKTGVTNTSLRPYGEADFDGVRLEVSSGGPLISQGTRVRAVAIRESRIVVEETRGN